MKIKALMTPEPQGNGWVRRVPVVTGSDHPKHPIGARLHWGFVEGALDAGYTVELTPASLNQTNCPHEKGFVKVPGQLGSGGRDYRPYICPICHEERYIPYKGETDPPELPVDIDWVELD